MSRQIIPALTTPFTPDELVSTLAAVYTSELGAAPDPIVLAILCAHVALETANGTRCKAWNVGNFKAPNMSAGPVDWCYFATTEYVNGAPVVLRPPNPGCAFAAFAGLTGGLTYYLRRMYDHWTLAWQACLMGNAQEFAAGLKRQGYYTAPVEAYSAGVCRWRDYYLARLGSSTAIPAPAAPEPSSMSDLALGWYIDTPSIVSGT